MYRSTRLLRIRFDSYFKADESLVRVLDVETGGADPARKFPSRSPLGFFEFWWRLVSGLERVNRECAGEPQETRSSRVRWNDTIRYPNRRPWKRPRSDGERNANERPLGSKARRSSRGSRPGPTTCSARRSASSPTRTSSTTKSLTSRLVAEKTKEERSKDTIESTPGFLAAAFQVSTHLEQPFEVYVYNVDTDEVRVVVLMPSGARRLNSRYRLRILRLAFESG